MLTEDSSGLTGQEEATILAHSGGAGGFVMVYWSHLTEYSVGAAGSESVSHPQKLKAREGDAKASTTVTVKLWTVAEAFMLSDCRVSSRFEGDFTRGNVQHCGMVSTS